MQIQELKEKSGAKLFASVLGKSTIQKKVKNIKQSLVLLKFYLKTVMGLFMEDMLVALCQPQAIPRIIT